MVTHSLIPGIKITVLVDGQPLEEYDCKNDETKEVAQDIAKHQNKRTTTKYIESITGKQFIVQLKVDSTFKFDSPNILFDVHVDGNSIDSPLCSKRDVKSARPWLENVAGPSFGPENT